MNGHALFTRVRVLLWWLTKPCAFIFRVIRVLREKRALPRYRAWLNTAQSRKSSLSVTAASKLTVAMPVFRVGERVLQQAIASVQSQTYHDFEFLILDDASPDTHVQRVLRHVAANDSRIRLLRNRTRAGISEASNRLLREARGDYVVFVDHDDLVPAHALATVVASIRRWPEVDWFFSDEDKLDFSESFTQPCLKWGFSTHLAFSWNFMAHLRVVSREKALALGGYRPQFEGAQDWDLALRFLVQGGSFRLIPEVLYHWRKVSGSMAVGSPAKASANLAAAKAINEALSSLLGGIKPQLAPLVPGASQFSVHWQAPRELGVTIIACKRTPKPHWSRPYQLFTVEDLADEEVIEACLQKAKQPVVAVLPPKGLDTVALENLVARLLLPGTAVVGGCYVAGNRVRASGFLVGNDEIWRDPLSGVHRRDPGYCNLAWLPQPRSLLLPWGFVGWRRDLQEGWRLGAGTPAPWRLTLGVAKLGKESVVLPQVRFSDPPPPLPKPQPPLPQAPYFSRFELELFNLCP